MGISAQFTFLKCVSVAMLVFCILPSRAGIAQEDTALSLESKAPTNTEIAELLRQFNEISRKVRSNPEVRELETKVEEAQKAYTTAYEAAMEKEAPQLLDKIRSLQRERLQALRKRTLHTEQMLSEEEVKLSPNDRAKLQKARALASKEADVIHYRTKVTSAVNEEQCEKAESEYLRILVDTMKRIDPEIDQILKKLKLSGVKSPAGKNNK